MGGATVQVGPGRDHTGQTLGHQCWGQTRASVVRVRLAWVEPWKDQDVWSRGRGMVRDEWV